MTTACYNSDLELLFGGDDSLLKPENFQQLIQVGCTGMLSSGLNHLRAFYWRVTLGTLSTEIDNWGKELSRKIDNYSVIKEESLPNLNKVQTDPLSAQMEDVDLKNNNGWRKYYHDLESAKFIQGDLERLYMAGVPENFFQTKERQDLILNVLFVWSTVHSTTAYRQGMHEIAASILYVLQLELVAWVESRRFHPNQSTHPLNEVISENHLEAHTYWIFESIMKHIEPLYSPLLEKTGCPFIVNYCTNIQDDVLPRLDPVLSTHLTDCGVHSQLYGMRWARLLLGREFPLTANQSLRIWDYMFACCFNSSSTGSGKGGKQVLSEKSGNNKKTDVEDMLVDVEDLDVKDSPLLKVLGQFMVAMILQIRKELLTSDANEVLTMLMRYPPLDDIEPVIRLVGRIRSVNFNTKELPAGTGAAMKSNSQSQPPFPNSSTSNSSERQTNSNAYQNPIFPDIPTPTFVTLDVKSLSDSAFEEGFDDDEDDDDEEEEEEENDKGVAKLLHHHHRVSTSVPPPPPAATTTSAATPSTTARHPRAAPPLAIINSPEDLSATMNVAAAEALSAASAWSQNTFASLKQSLNFPSNATTTTPSSTSTNAMKSTAPAQQLRTFSQVPPRSQPPSGHKKHEEEGGPTDRRKEAERVSERVRDVSEWLQSYVPPSYGTGTEDHCNMDQKSCKLTVEELVDLTARLSTLADILIGESSIKVYDHSYGSAKAAAVGRKAAKLCKATVKQNPNTISRSITRGVEETQNRAKQVTNTATASTNIGNSGSSSSSSITTTTTTTHNNNENKSGNVKRILISDPLTLEF